MKDQQLFLKSWCNESATKDDPKCKEIFTQGSPRKKNDLAHEMKVKYTLNVMEPSISLHTVFNFVDAEDVTKKKTLDQPLENDLVTSKLEHQTLSAETNDPNPEIMFKQTIVPNVGVNLNFYSCTLLYTVLFVINPITLFQFFFRKLGENEERKRNFSSRLKSRVKSFIQYFRAYQNQTLPEEQPSSYPVNYYSRSGYDSRNRSTSRN